MWIGWRRESSSLRAPSIDWMWNEDRDRDARARTHTHTHMHTTHTRTHARTHTHVHPRISPCRLTRRLMPCHLAHTLSITTDPQYWIIGKNGSFSLSQSVVYFVTDIILLHLDSLSIVVTPPPPPTVTTSTFFYFLGVGGCVCVGGGCTSNLLSVFPFVWTLSRRYTLNRSAFCNQTWCGGASLGTRRSNKKSVYSVFKVMLTASARIIKI